ncbi:triacylglycerol lipase [Trichoderma cornu-damae]|uniref:Carboxylic ester hydrolase n=1 Tax=Trichoderma cornu-damae TaxID=654480 RepID=A0A9P8QR36_9HYPO|nr:triacylglycerol lipase [Trichoderma cornu-damae]
MKLSKTLLALLGFSSLAVAAPAPAPENSEKLEARAPVSVQLASGTIVGSSLGGIDTFNGIPYADPPVGNLRLSPPQKLSKNLGTWTAPLLAPSCPQQFVSSGSQNILMQLLGSFLQLPFLQPITGQEDCLNISVQRPKGTKAGDKLPVAFWIYGGGFQLGSTVTYDGSSLLSTAIYQGQPFIYVAVNYRVAGFGFLPGAEVLKNGAANLGLLDQRMGLQWVADNIAAFGGDPDKVTIWGESAGAISVFDQMLLYGGNATYNGKPLFRGAIMNSGTAVPAEPIDSPKAQAVYDNVVSKAGCSGSADTLACLRQAPYGTFLNAVNSAPTIFSYNSVALSYLPRPDGVVLPDSPDVLFEQGKYYPVPMIVGDQEDEGTLFSLFQTDVTSTSSLVNWLSDYMFFNATKAQLTQLVETYDAAISSGSPFRTGIFNELYPGFKRTSALLGDLVFTLTRRMELAAAAKVNPGVPIWSYLSSYDYGTPFLGTFHASDILQVFYGLLPNNAMHSTRTYFFNFIQNLDPNVGVQGFSNWPKWADNQQLMWFQSADSNSLLADDFRDDSYQWIVQNKNVLKV